MILIMIVTNIQSDPDFARWIFIVAKLQQPLYNGHFRAIRISRYWNATTLDFAAARMMEMVVTTGCKISKAPVKS